MAMTWYSCSSRYFMNASKFRTLVFTQLWAVSGTPLTPYQAWTLACQALFASSRFQILE